MSTPHHAGKGGAQTATPVAARSPAKTAVSRTAAQHSWLTTPLTSAFGLLQRKVVIGPANDAYEREADGVADRVSSGTNVNLATVSRVTPQAIAPIAQRQASEEEPEKAADEPDTPTSAGGEAAEAPAGESEEEQPVQTLAIQRVESESSARDEPDRAVQREALEPEEKEPEPPEPAPVVQEKPASAGAPPAPARVAVAASAIQNRDAGAPIERSTRSTLESRMGVDLGAVRVHSNHSAQQAASSINARAFTHGKDIWLGRGESPTNTRLLAHEVTHVFQQDAVVRRKPIEEEKKQEEEEEKLKTAPPVIRSAPPAVSSAIATASAPQPAALTAEEKEPPKERVVEAVKPAAPAAPSREAVSGGAAAAAPPEKAPAVPAAEPEPAAEAAAPEATPAPAAATEAAPPAAAAAPVEAPAEAPPKSPEEASKPAEPAAPAAAAAPPAEPVVGAAPGAAPAPVGAAAGAPAAGGAPAAVAAPKAAPGVAEAGPAPAPEAKAAGQPAPETDPRFQAVQSRLEKSAKTQKRRQPPVDTQVGVAERATVQPENEPVAYGMTDRVGELKTSADQTDPAATEKEKSFEQLLEEAIERLTPKTPEDVENLGETAPGSEQMRADVKGGVKKETQDTTSTIKDKSAEPVTAKGHEKDEALKPLPAEAPPPRVGAEDVLPEQKSDAEISFEGEKKESADELAKTGLSEEQLAKANEPTFSAAVAAKQEVVTDADAAPGRYRAAEQEYLGKSAKEVKSEENAARGDMKQRRKSKKQGQRSKQEQLKQQRETEKQMVTTQIQIMFHATKIGVTIKLGLLDYEVDRMFEEGHKAAFDTLKANVKRRLNAWKADRYDSSVPLIGGLIDAGTWVYDKIRGIDHQPGVKKIYCEERAAYLSAMKGVFSRIAKKVESTIVECRNLIQAGKDRIDEFVKSKTGNLAKFAKEAQKNIGSEFEALQQSVDDKKGELADRLASKYKESRDSVDKFIEEERAKNRGLIAKLVDLVKKIIEVIRKLKKLLFSILAKVASAIDLIISDPIQFLRNLLDSVKQGFFQFKENIVDHLKAGIMGWLFGTLASAGITMPKEFTLKSIFGLVLEILGITASKIRSKVVKLVGARNVEMLERAWEFVSTLISEGPAGLWEKVKGYLSDLQDTIVEQVKEFVITTIVKNAVLKLVSLFNPVGAFIQAALAIYNVVMFFIERIEQILELVNTVVNSIYEIALGKIAVAAGWVEKAMGKTIPLIISFLARLLGLGGISDRVAKIIRRLQDRVDKVIDKVLGKIVGGIRKVLGKGKALAVKGAKKIKELLFPKKVFKVGTETHSVEAVGIRNEIIIRSKAFKVPDFLDFALRVNPTDKVKRLVPKLKLRHAAYLKMPNKTEGEKEKKRAEYLEISALVQEIWLSIPTKPPKPSVVTWATFDKHNRAKSVTAKFLSKERGSLGKGSTPEEDIVGWADQKPGSRSRTGRIRAHLLHHNLYGPGTAINMTPTSSSTNQKMYNFFERSALAFVKKGRTIEYKVSVTYPPENTKKPFKHFAESINMEAKDVDKGVPVGHGSETIVNDPRTDPDYK